MSASLVGSEMCIRDRLARGSLPAQAPKGTLSSCRQPTAKSAITGATSVSYTHLTLPTICSV
eukprot:1103918-Alexandrium_andersonii.AAC.1